MFLFLGGVLLLLIGALEYFMWLSSGMRALLLWLGIGLEAFLLIRFIAVPAMRLLRLRHGLTHKEGSRLIGRHFSHVSDKLYNLLELAENPQKTELLLASIEQRSRELMEVPFQRAINMSEAYKYARYVSIPVVLALLIWVSGKGIDFLNSFKRVATPEIAYERPAPFQFELLTPTLRQREDLPFVLKLETVGEIQPDQVMLVLNGSSLIMEKAGGHFEYTFQPPLQQASFYFESAGISSRSYNLEVMRIPVIDRFEMEFSYPPYLGLADEQISGSGNATVPEGTTVTWKIRAVHADSILYSDLDTLYRAPSVDEGFSSFSKRFWRKTPYSVSASNRDVGEYDRLKYLIEVIPDEYPEIKVLMERDTLNPNSAYFEGVLSDDYGLSGLKLVCYPEGEKSAMEVLELPVPGTTNHTFYYTFPSGLQVSEDKEYILYFELKDNDGNKGGKVRKSREFSLRVLNKNELEREQLNAQKELLNKLGKRTRQQEELEKSLEEFNRLLKEKEALGYEEKQKLQDFLQRQEKQEQLMQKFSKELSESLEQEESTPESELLKERLERQEAEAERNAALMEEMQKILDKLDQEAFEERMEELSKAQTNNKRSMQQLLELTKRYYVQQKSRQLSEALRKLSERQMTFSEIRLDDSYNTEEQRKLNDRFGELREELEQLDKDNRDLQKPLPWKRDIDKEESVTRDQKDALEGINKQEGREQASDMDEGEQGNDTRRKQQNAARKLKELSEQLNQGATAGGAQSIAEDAEMLRQILDNLLKFSLEQEGLFNKIQEGGDGGVNQSEDVRKQKELRVLFEHVDDSLFALSLRRAEISELINKQITEVFYNIDKGLESFENNNRYRGASYQQYVVTAANELGAFLADLLDNMQESMMPGQGQGQGGDFQLPDIIQSQEELRQRAMQKGSQGSEQGTGQDQSAGEKPGEQGSEGKEGESGAEGKEKGQGQGGQEGTGGEEKGGNEGESSGTSGNDESSYAEFFEIYKEQQKIREQLEQQLQDLMNEGDRKLAEQIAREMELFEEELLRSGITERTADRLNRIQQQLMRLENAALEQGEKRERESESTKRTFSNPILTRPEVFERNRRDIEFLNKEALPLRRIYRERVKEYFNRNDSISSQKQF